MQTQSSQLQPLSPSEGIAMGKVLRSLTPRSSHGEWEIAINRDEPIALLEASNQ